MHLVEIVQNQASANSIELIEIVLNQLQGFINVQEWSHFKYQFGITFRNGAHFGIGIKQIGLFPSKLLIEGGETLIR